jgi:hypothetical protein
MLVDVSAAGPSGRRAAWLASLGRAVVARSDVAAVTYHPSGPYADERSGAARAWQLDHDTASLTALRTAFRSVVAS